MMASSDVIREYLISLSYKIDTASQSKFDASIKAADYSFTKLARTASLAGAAVFAAMTKISASLDTLYFASERTKASAENLTAFGYAASQTGASADAAAGSIENMASRMRRLPNLTGLMRNMGVAVSGDPTKDILAMHRQLADKPMWLQLQYADMLGIEERVWLGLDKMDKFINQRNRDARMMGMNYEQATKNANQLWTSLRRIADIFYMIAVKVQDNLFKRWGVDIDSFTNKVVANSRQIIDTVTNLFQVLLTITAAFSLRMLASPFGALLALVAGLLLVLDDYQGWLNGKDSAFKYDMFDKMRKSVDDMLLAFLGVDKQTAHWIENIAVAAGLLAAIPLTLRAISTGVALLAGTRAAPSAAAAAVGGGWLGRIFLGALALLGVAGVVDMAQHGVTGNIPDGDFERRGLAANGITSSGGALLPPSGDRRFFRGGIGATINRMLGLPENPGNQAGRSGANLSPAERTSNAAEVAKTLRGLGWGEAQIAGALANFKAESDFDPTNHNTIGEDSYGMGQWSVERRKRFLEFSGGRPMEGTSAVEQARFLDWEMKKYYPQVWASMNRAENRDNPYAQGAIIDHDYEVPADRAGQDQARGFAATDFNQVLGTPQFAGAYPPASGGTTIVNNEYNINGARNPSDVANEIARSQRDLIVNARPRIQ